MNVGSSDVSMKDWLSFKFFFFLLTFKRFTFYLINTMEYDITLGLNGSYQPSRTTTAKNRSIAKGILKEWRERKIEENAIAQEKHKNEVTEIQENGDSLFFDIKRSDTQIDVRAEAVPK